MFFQFPQSRSKLQVPAVRERGAALVLALLVVVVVTLLASTIASDFLVTFRRVENQLLGKQAFSYMRGAEGIARSALQSDYKLNPNKDHISEGWLNTSQQFPLDGGVISGTICDLQGRFNLNSLGASASRAGDFNADQQMFIRLLQTLSLANGEVLGIQQAEELVNAVSDWIDSDDDSRPEGGAEADYYSGLELPYRAANRLLNSTSELLWIRGFDDIIVRALEPYVAALPAAVQLNVNTASASVLASINENNNLSAIDDSELQSILSTRDGNIDSGNIGDLNSGFDSSADFIAAHPAENLDPSRFSVKSDYFLLDSSTVFQGRTFRLFSVLYRDPGNGNIKTIARANSGLGSCDSFNE